jgi:hypothetical protein
LHIAPKIEHVLEYIIVFRYLLVKLQCYRRIIFKNAPPAADNPTQGMRDWLNILMVGNDRISRKQGQDFVMISW